jgi:hypothetical protein
MSIKQKIKKKPLEVHETTFPKIIVARKKGREKRVTARITCEQTDQRLGTKYESE